MVCRDKSLKVYWIDFHETWQIYCAQRMSPIDFAYLSESLEGNEQVWLRTLKIAPFILGNPALVFFVTYLESH